MDTMTAGLAERNRFFCPSVDQGRITAATE